MAQVENNLAIAQDIINQGKAAAQSKSYGKAFSNFEDAKSIANETQDLIEAKDGLLVDMDLQVNPFR